MSMFKLKSVNAKTGEDVLASAPILETAAELLQAYAIKHGLVEEAAETYTPKCLHTFEAVEMFEGTVYYCTTCDYRTKEYSDDLIIVRKRASIDTELERERANDIAKLLEYITSKD